MAAFTVDDIQRLDWKILQNGANSLFIDNEALEEAVEWFREHDYHVYEFDCRRWKTEDDFHDDVRQVLGFVDFYGYSLDAFRDNLIRMAEGQADFYMVLSLQFFHNFMQRHHTFAFDILNIIEHASRSFLLRGDRLIALIQSVNRNIEFKQFGARPILLNPIEFIRSAAKNTPDN